MPGKSLDSRINEMRVKRSKKKKSSQNIESNCTEEQVEMNESSESEDFNEDDNNVGEDGERIFKKGTKTKDFFEEGPTEYSHLKFTDMNLSRPILKAINEMKFTNPTPIQCATIPVALMGKDICGCAATGTGKTAAFVLPIMERLLFRPVQVATSRVLILVPTRELAIQVHSVSKSLAKFTNIEICLATGGLELKSQEAALRKNPDVIIATPGRLVDFLHNTPSFDLQFIEILVLDEADRMLDENYRDQIEEIVKFSPKGRQTMLFSATMTEEVNELVTLSLNRPVKLFIDNNTDVAENLRQEFVRIKKNREEDRTSIVVALCSRGFHENCLIFVHTKQLAHRLRIFLGLLGINADELHGNLTQLQRLEALNKFKKREVDVLVATDLASRGLDVVGVKTVINFSMPNSIKQYIHRVGRTARAGLSGRSISLVGENGRKLLKEIVKEARNPVKSRVIAPEIIEKFKKKLKSFEDDVQEILKQEKEDRELRISEMEVSKAKNMIMHRGEIESRPPRVWFQVDSSKEDKKTSKKSRKSTKLKNEKKLEPDELKAIHFQQYLRREEKRKNRKKRLHAFSSDDKDLSAKPTKKRKKTASKTGGSKAFEKELTDTSRKALKEFRSSSSLNKKNGMAKRKQKAKIKKR
ncbi:probable ATP-dependent RNA helicase DDX27 isoform X2 [Xenia sp. Carnegie-2017]|uniref:probable ATP-dependent RNA helicase DDX27 isoform X2 n=1 Tax=Xenia sp. Carnegie-2017 TaxID=2897299 RepID=UPI001F040D89|nr:probable ATP-dependent RNA helicase DDX27 isoform X2 [Xenia sp. Carnegie-2017]XP_046843702.1 probable ATP-dependent RNA helicase DDX27 isoform X2 [Xenia sp. Carnegie-2017]XP_046843703.1 probable ATP-dependent RNA helicase DDX27 isoform X2 [Xenia sp. Carnegie-2017]XP_046843704.1 probable ATP-dependent RNA helicase DDX27 isoform X2 [Xenia sp. Carnegie-2017]